MIHGSRLWDRLAKTCSCRAWSSTMAKAINWSRLKPPSRYTCISFGLTAPSRRRWRTTSAVTPKRAAISSAPHPRSSASARNASNWSAGCIASRVTFSSRLISCGSFAVSMMQRTGSVFLISLRFARRSWATLRPSPTVTK